MHYHSFHPANKSSVGDVQIAAIRCDPVSAAGKLDASQKVLCLSIRPPCGRQSHPAALVTVLCLSNGPVHPFSLLTRPEAMFQKFEAPELAPERPPLTARRFVG
jgi:hypothetical protein